MAQSLQTTRCCGASAHVVALTGDSSVELVRCGSCGLSTWRLDGREVPKAEALGAISKAFAPATPHRRVPPVRTRTAATPPPAAPELGDLLAGWQVLGENG
jgi:hypothetical protein